jgi:Ca-activated chloride channel homolog
VIAFLLAVLVLAGIFGIVFLIGRLRPKKPETTVKARAVVAKAKKERRAQGSPWVLRAAILLLVLAAASLVAGLAQFRFAKTEKGPTIMLVIDASQTMDRTDIVPTRLVAAQNAARAFLQKLPPEFKVGLVTYAIQPAVLATPTTDHAAVETALASPPRGDRTVIGEGLSAALDTIESEWGRNGRTDSAVILLSDGLDTSADTIAPLDVATRAHSMGVPIDTVVLGQTGTPHGVDMELMSQIATTTGGSVSTASTAGELTSVYQTLGGQLSTQLEIGSRAQFFIPVAVLLAMLASVLVVMRLSRPQY